MVLEYACIAPHGAEIIPQLAGKNLKAFSTTRKGMETIAAEVKAHRIETIIIASPHNLRLRNYIGVITAEYTDGTLKADDGSLQMRFACDRNLAEAILRSAEKAKLPVVGVNYGTAEGTASCMPMDWGTLIPLWFMGCQEKKPKVVIVTPSREIPVDNLVKFGRVIAGVAEASKTRVAFVASADQAHAHSKKGPYGFHPAAARFDNLIVNAARENSLRKLLTLDQRLVEDAKPDSIWQIAVLIGVLRKVLMKARFISYEAPTYFGMLCADYVASRDLR